MDRNLSWRGLCIEPNAHYLPGHLSERTCDVAQQVVSSTAAAAAQRSTRFRFSGGTGTIVSSAADEASLKEKIFARFDEESRRKAGFARFKRSIEAQFTDVPMTDIATVLQAARAPRQIDYLSLDVRRILYLRPRKAT